MKDDISATCPDIQKFAQIYIFIINQLRNNVKMLIQNVK